MNLLYALDLLGTAAFAASGAWAGVRRDMDLFGVVLLGLVTANGGGTVRDLLLGAPPFILKNETYLYLSLLVSLLVFVFHRKMEFLQREVYASACIAGGILLYLLHFTVFPPDWALVVSAMTVIVVRLLAIQKGWSLPRAT